MASRTTNNSAPLTLAVKIDKSLKMGNSVIDAAAGDWVINYQKARNVTTIVAISDKHEREVFTVSEPTLIPGVGKKKNRIRFKIINKAPTTDLATFKRMEPFTFRSAVKYL